MRVKQKEPDQTGRTRGASVWSGQVKGGPRTLVGSALDVNSGPFSLQSGLDMAPVLVGPGRATSHPPASLHRPGPVQEKLANITKPPAQALELAVIYSGVHVKVRAGGSPQPSPL